MNNIPWVRACRDLLWFSFIFVCSGFIQITAQDLNTANIEEILSVAGVFKFEGEPYSGKAIDYHPNGAIKTLWEFKDGLYHGVRKEWYPDGTLKLIRHYDQNKPAGTWQTYTEAGIISDQGDDSHLFYSNFFGEHSVPDGFEETSPSITADGNTMVFARYREWERKIPFIAHRVDGKWTKHRLHFADTLYNLAINPKGDRIVYKKFEQLNGKKVSRVFVVEKRDNLWGEPEEVHRLFNRNAGYFHMTPDNTLYFFARDPKTGIFYAKPSKKNTYSRPKWLSHAVSLDDSDSFDVLMHPDKKKLIVSQYYDEEKYPDRGEVGLYYYEKKGRKWTRVKRLPLGYGWGPCITDDRQFIFVRKGGIQHISLDELGIPWN